MVPYEPDVCNRKRRKGTELSLWLPRRDAGHLDGAQKGSVLALQTRHSDASAITLTAGEDLRDAKLIGSERRPRRQFRHHRRSVNRPSGGSSPSDVRYGLLSSG